MTKTNRILGCAAILAASGMAACGGGPEGTYKLDKAATKKQMEADSAKLPQKEQEMAKFAIALVEAMDVTLELKSGGAASQKQTMPSLTGKAPTTKDETGTWKKADDGIMITIAGKDQKCTQSGKTLTCRDPSGKGKGTLIYSKS